MRQEPETEVAAPLPPCAPHSSSCRWWPYSNSNDFEANAALILIILSTALICALVLNTAIRCFLRRSREPSRPEEDGGKPDMEAALVVAPTIVFSAGMKLAGTEAECAICLSEFVEGEGIQVLGRCKHGFHVQCIQKWLSSHSSCPTCRRSCLASSTSSSEETEICCPENGDNTQIQIHSGARQSTIELL
ncbi:putative RING-H2 finger protein ATL5M precursor [Tripterygium wilfordii]|uniref:RING-type E3 ubiquitin transferase n=1 Tax=Tripterygium wilfordii TaxID=458696 RepID=A0A7J7CLI9_TRIWF|nr:RING-H2 finger protein ATL79-like [Tripterygium wilfordii]KAF5734930.1 putative RING-H2 finger protein ATL5M precursor [Tripterygium wilfordii]